MKPIVISHPTIFPNEHRVIESLFENGLEIFHIHKPNFSEQEIQNYIQQFSEKYHSRIFLHSEFPKFHSLKELEECKEKYEYAFLSPIFDSISKKDYKSNFDLQELKRKFPLLLGEGQGGVIALGGIDEDKIETCRQLGFVGVAVLGAIWQSKNQLEKFKRLNLLCHAERSEASILDSSLRSE